MSEILAIVSRDADYLMLSSVLRGSRFRITLVDIPSEPVSIAEESKAAAIIVDCQPRSRPV